ncbi:hypothetical protein [Aquibaculum sediminis]|uniref:hypothetical protein n=1 Tax=Aquibaculum sediminis TaxID=3231907 RepID=UPI003452F3F2
MNAKRLLKLVTAIFLCAAVPALADQDREKNVAGTLQWGEGSIPLTAVHCGESEDAFLMRADGEGLRLTLSFSRLADAEEGKLPALSAAVLQFSKDHPFERALFAMYASLGDMSQYSAGLEGASGTQHLRAGNGPAFDRLPEGMDITYQFRCTQ